MIYRSSILVLVLAVLLLAGCKLESGAEGGPIPTIGPVHDDSQSAERASMTLTASTNCAEVGELVTFTLQIANTTSTPLTLKGTPLLDIVIQPARWLKAGPAPIQRWSTSSEYPSDITPALAPSEARTYQWHWPADAVYVQPGFRDSTILVTAATAVLRPGDPNLQGNTTRLYVGVRSLDWGLGGIRCIDMRR